MPPVRKTKDQIRVPDGGVTAKDQYIIISFNMVKWSYAK